MALHKRIKHLITAAVQVGLILLLIAGAKLFPQMFPAFYTDSSRKAVRFLGGLSGNLPFPVWQILLLALIGWQLISLVGSLCQKEFLDWLCRLPLILSTLALVFVALWGLNFFGPGVGDAVDLEVGTYTQSELKQALDYYARQASSWSDKVERDEYGDLVLPSEGTLSRSAVECYAQLAQENPRFSGTAPEVKFLLGSEAFGYLGVTGVYVCFTGESSVSRAAHAVSIPFTMCHELGHSLCFCAEDEANFAGFLACSRSQDPLFRYSGYLNAFLYCYNALYKLDAATARSCWNQVSDQVLHDCNAAREHYQQYDGAVQDVAQSVNDAYLRSFDQEGTQSYDLVTDHLIAYYFEKILPGKE